MRLSMPPFDSSGTTLVLQLAFGTIERQLPAVTTGSLPGYCIISADTVIIATRELSPETSMMMTIWTMVMIRPLDR